MKDFTPDARSIYFTSLGANNPELAQHANDLLNNSSLIAGGKFTQETDIKYQKALAILK
jgi:hypothetical protein